MLILCWSNVLLFPGPIDLLTSFTVFKSRSFMEGHFFTWTPAIKTPKSDVQTIVNLFRNESLQQLPHQPDILTYPPMFAGSVSPLT